MGKIYHKALIFFQKPHKAITPQTEKQPKIAFFVSENPFLISLNRFFISSVIIL